MPDNEGSAAIVDSIVTLARRLDLQVIAEGIEEVEQLQFLHDLGCEAGQGFLFSPAMSSQDFGRHLGDASQAGAAAA